MTFEESVRHLMRTHPSLYWTRARALDGLFMHFGSGTYWTDDGDIGNAYENVESEAAYAAKHPLVRAKEQYERSRAERLENVDPESLKRDLAWCDEFYEEKVATIKDVLDNLEERASGEPCLVEHHFYGLLNKGTAPIQHVPKDCPADWVMGAREMCALILACPFEETEGKDLARNQRLAKRILKDLDKRFGKADLPDVSYATWNEKHPFSDTVKLRKKMKEVFADLESA
jgi:hypothetical protein